MHAFLQCHAYTRTHSTHICKCEFPRLSKISRPVRSFFFLIAAIRSTPLLITRTQCGGQTSNRFHVAKILNKKLMTMAYAVIPFYQPSHQAPFWTFLYASRCQPISSTSSQLSEIPRSPVRRSTCMLLTNKRVPLCAHTLPVYFSDPRDEKEIGDPANEVLDFISAHILFQCPNP